MHKGNLNNPGAVQGLLLSPHMTELNHWGTLHLQYKDSSFFLRIFLILFCCGVICEILLFCLNCYRHGAARVYPQLLLLT